MKAKGLGAGLWGNPSTLVNASTQNDPSCGDHSRGESPEAILSTFLSLTEKMGPLSLWLLDCLPEKKHPVPTKGTPSCSPDPAPESLDPKPVF